MIAAIDWSPMFDLDLENSLNFFYDCINSVIGSCIPGKKTKWSEFELQLPRIVHWGLAKYKAVLHKRYKSSEWFKRRL